MFSEIFKGFSGRMRKGGLGCSACSIRVHPEFCIRIVHCCAHPAFASATYRRTASRSTCCFQHTRRSGTTTPPRSTRRSPGPCIHTTYTTSVWRLMYGNDVYNQRVALEYGGMGLFVGLRGLLPLPAQHNHRHISFVLWKCLIYVDLRHVL